MKDLIDLVLESLQKPVVYLYVIGGFVSAVVATALLAPRLGLGHPQNDARVGLLLCLVVVVEVATVMAAKVWRGKARTAAGARGPKGTRKQPGRATVEEKERRE